MDRKGFTLIEIIAVLAVLAVLAGLAAPLVYKQILKARQEATEQELDVLKTAMLGDSDLKTGGVRTDYGYLGDMGILPGQGEDSPSAEDLNKLLTQGDQPSYSFSPNYGIGAGWQGPYLQRGSANDEVTLDAFGSAYEYDVRNPTGLASDDWIAKVTSLGPDKTSDTTDDISVEIKKKESFATVFGYVNTTEGRQASNLYVTLHYPSGGTLTNTTTSTNSQGYYEFNNIPFGVRSITLDPKLQFAAGSAKTTGGGDDLEFNVTNYSAYEVTITAVTVEYSISPDAYYSEMKLAGRQVFSASGPRPRKGSGETVNVSPPVAVTGSGVPFQPIVVHVNAASNRISNIDISKLEAGATIKVEINDFRDRRRGGRPVDVTGVQFTVTFQLSDGTSSVVTFTPIAGQASGGGTTPSCDSYTVVNKKNSSVWIRGGGYPICTKIKKNKSFTIQSGETISIYDNLNRCARNIDPSDITFDMAAAADSDGDCTVGWTNSGLGDL
jgi:prepilin-type N-terminal cleavage/methylation domain-containing protein